MPYLMTRFTALAARPDIAQRLPNGLLYEVQKLYFDTANFFNPYPWPSLLKLMPVSHILFGTDFPFSSASEVAKGLRQAALNASDLRAIERENALTLFPRIEKIAARDSR